MSDILSSENFGDKIYNRFPPIYQEDDVKENFALKRYIQSLADGGFKYSIDEINGLLDLVNPDKTDEKVLPILFKQYGLEVFNGIPANYLRYLLPRLGKAWSKKGSLSVIEFISSSLSGIKTRTDVRYDKDGNPLITVTFEMDYSMGDYFPDVEQFNRLLKNFIPFYCDMVIHYMYMYHEIARLKGKDTETLKITDTKEENGVIPSHSMTKYVAQLNLNDKQLNDDFELNEVESTTDETDYYEDTITYGITESASFGRSLGVALTNNFSHTLNNNFGTNTTNCYDVIIENGERRIAFC